MSDERSNLLQHPFSKPVLIGAPGKCAAILNSSVVIASFELFFSSRFAEFCVAVHFFVVR
jgi:hypothetical protein